MVERYTPHDETLAEAARMEIGPEDNLLPAAIDKITFQFPPKVTADGKSSIWKLRSRVAYEPIVTWDGANPRAITVEMTYVVSGDPWTAEKIRDITREFKRYHYGKISGRATIHIITMKLFDIVGANGKFRITDTSVKYSDNYVTQGEITWPKVTTITINCELVTQTDVGGEIEKNKLVNLEKIAEPQWY